MKKILSYQFFQKSGIKTAKSLLGKYLVRYCHSLIRANGGIRKIKKEIALMINEVELYKGFGDKSSHAFGGNKGRASIMFGPGGHWYIYLCYGMYEMLNLVVGKAGFPAAILIRGAGQYHGPGKLTCALKIRKSLNKKPANKKSGLWIEDRGVKISEKDIMAGPRIGLGEVGAWAKTPYRFYLKNR